MKIAVISDIHGNMAYLLKAKGIIEDGKIGTVICCGDVQDEEVFHEIDSWTPQVYLALGNADKELERKLDAKLLKPLKLKYYRDYGELTLESKNLAFCHYDNLATKLAMSNKYDLVFYGHTHTPWEEIMGKTVTLNPGEIAAQFGKATFAIYDLAEMKAKLIILG